MPGISVVALSALPVIHHGVGYNAELKQSFSSPGYATSLGGFFENDPVLGVISRLGLHGTVLKVAEYYVGILAATILFIATNAGMIGISRLSWSLAEHRQLPQLFSRLHSTLPDAVVHADLLLGPRGRADPATATPRCSGNLYSFGAMLSFTTAHAAIVALRIKDPDRERPYRAPWDVRINVALEIPMTAVIGGIGTAGAWVAVVVLHGEARDRRYPLDDRRDVRVLLLPKTSGPGPAQVLPAAAARAPRGLRGARIHHGARPDLRRRRQRDGAGERGQADRRGRHRLRDLSCCRCPASSPSSPVWRRRRRMGARCSRAPASRPGARASRSARA